MRVILRMIVVTVIAALELFLLVLLLHSYDVEVGQYGFIIGPDNESVVEVEPGLPAALAGLKAGDRIVYESLPLVGRRLINLKEPVPAHAPLSLQYDHEGSLQSITMYAQPIPATYVQMTAIASALSGFVFGIIGLILVMLRPSKMTWAFAIIAPIFLLPLTAFFWAQSTETMSAALFDCGVSLLYACQITGLLAFASRFPNDNPRGFAKVIDRLSIPVGLLIAVMYCVTTLTVRFSHKLLPNWEMISNYALLLPSLAALSALIYTYVTTHGSVRSRLAPVIGSFLLLIVFSSLQQILPEITRNNGLMFAAFFANAVAPALVGVAVAYGVIRHRMMDINFIIERTLVYTILTVLVVAIFSAVEFFVGKLFEQGSFADMVQMAAAVAVGVSINYVHGKLEHFLNMIFFRRRYATRKRLYKTAQTLAHATTLELIDEMLVDEPADALSLASAAVFRRDGDGYKRVASKGWADDETNMLEQDDHLIVRLRSEGSSLKLGEFRWPRNDLPNGLARPIYVVPVLLGNLLEAVLLYSGHRTGEDLDSDERKSLNILARNAALAYGHLMREQLNNTLRELQVENETLHKIGEKMETLLKSRLN
jgi:hypothetical protein